MENTKPVQVVMLPQVKNNTTFPAIAQVHCLDNKLELCEDGLLRTPCTYNHLYFISTDPNEEIKEGDWVYNEELLEELIHQVRVVSNCIEMKCKKIIASTDPSLSLPAIPSTWIRDVYVPSNGSIKEVRLKLEQYAVNTYGLRYDGEPDIDFRLKLTPNNEVVIVDELFEKQKESFIKAATSMTGSATLTPEFKALGEFSTKLDSIDQELEDAAKEWKNKLLFLDSSLEDIADMLTNSWKSGANWKAEQSANDAIEFADWCENNYWPTAQTGKWRAEFSSEDELLTTKQLYELWQQNKKK